MSLTVELAGEGGGVFSVGVPKIGCVYDETIKRELNRRRIYECQCDDRLKAKAEGSTRLPYNGCRCKNRTLIEKKSLAKETDGPGRGPANALCFLLLG